MNEADSRSDFPSMYFLFDCTEYCASPKAPTFGDWRFASAKPPYKLQTWPNILINLQHFA